MEVYVKSTNINVTKKELKSEVIGNFYSTDRFYTLLNEYIDKNLKYQSRVMHIIVSYIYKSSNYKHDSTIANGRNVLPIIIDFIGISSFITFIVLLLSAFGVVIFKSINNIGNIANTIEKIFLDYGGAPLFSLAIFFGIIGIIWLIMFFKIRKKNAKLSLKDYVLKKTNTILNLRWLIKSNCKAKKKMKFIKSKEKKIYCIENFETQGSSTDTWLNIQLINLLSSIFPDFNLIFKFNNLSDEQFNELFEISKHDFKNIELLK